MYRALYRKWRPQRFEDVVGQRAIVTALKNQITANRVGHAYLFTGVRGTGKTTCAKIFAKAVNCLHPVNGDPCGECEICRGIDNGSILDVVEMDAASNNGVDDIRDLRDETAYTPSACKYKVYIIDEVHMLSTAAFNALLKTLEEPPAHVIFILATTEIQKVPATILSRCQRYDFTRIGPEDIARRVEYIAGEEKLELTPDGAELIARLADGALRDALSILDTCAGVTAKIDADVVRRMAGVTDRSYLFRISDALEAQDGAAALAQLAQLRQQSVDVKRLTEELIAHYRALMLAALPGGQALLSGVSPEEEALYLEKGPQLGQREAIRAIRALGSALEHMTRGSDQRIELELALFSLSEPPQQMQAVPVQAVPARAAAQPAVVQPFASAPAAQPFASAPARLAPTAEPTPAQPQEAVPVQPAVPAASVPQTAVSEQAEISSAPAEETLPLPEEPPVQQTETPLPWEEPPASVEQPTAPEPVQQPSVPPVQEKTADPVPGKSDKTVQEGIAPFPYWEQVVQQLQEKDPMLYTYLRKSKAYFDGTRVLIDGGKTFRDFIRANRDSQRLIKKLIANVSGVAVPIGPYEPKTAGKAVSNAEQSLRALEKLGLDVSIEDSARKKRS
ncbi:DNA polymerase III subunit gamma/tau [Faecalibacterium wellingii]|uniref:DNA-directed DNA polymerase n=1 Tax=Faecalibacterium wellingii TaxID=2929491 RepID=A0ABU3TV71_9FIRM|nr:MULTISPECIES: DNA polymerase III subunit gamma/tau [Faecalibacterium]MDU8687193.1 DNA polymerase III subunit gamma/tau [Faecalibacterium prausnitzii]UQK57667.1 DNA polymerase III subunit gamma/tau [Faecalibacterium sp. HTF-F]